MAWWNSVDSGCGLHMLNYLIFCKCMVLFTDHTMHKIVFVFVKALLSTHDAFGRVRLNISFILLSLQNTILILTSRVELKTFEYKFCI